MNERKRAVIAEAVAAEIAQAEAKWGKGYASAHEAYGVLLEEVDEFWDEVRKKRAHRDRRLIVKELVQVACVAQRYAVQVLEEVGPGFLDDALVGVNCAFVVSGGVCGRPSLGTIGGHERCAEHAGL